MSSASLTASLPKSLFGYEPVRKLGRGAGSTIYVVADPRSAQLYALKHVVPQTAKDVRFVEQLRNEFEVSKPFRHAGLRKCVDFKVSKRLFGGIKEAALVAELVDGSPIDVEHPGGLAQVADCFVRAGEALAALHYLRLVHCDLKPGNILRDAGGNVKVIDFGQACKTGTTKQRVQGTPDYIAPEQVKCRPVGVYTDVFNFGATLYWALTGSRVPTLITTDRKSRNVLVEQLFPKPREINPMVPEDLSAIVMLCVRVGIDYRPRSIAEILQVLAPYAPASGTKP